MLERGYEIKVLDHGYVRVVDFMGSDEAIIEAARMSTGRGFVGWGACQECARCKQKFRKQTVIGYKCVDGTEDHDWRDAPGDEKLLAHLYANKHLTPFECGGELMIEVQAPLMVFREWHRHRTQSYNEFSARYAQMPDLHYVPSKERMSAAQQSTANKQGSQDGLDEYVAEVFRTDIAEEQAQIYRTYDAAVAKGVAKEVARLNTPVSRYSKMRVKTDLRNWLAFLQLRMAPNAQWEIRQYANAVAEIVKEIWPRTYALFEEHDLHGVHLSRTEARALAAFMRNKSGEDLTDLGPSTEKLVKKLEGIR